MNDNTEAWIIAALIAALLAIVLFGLVFLGEVTADEGGGDMNWLPPDWTIVAEHPSAQTWPSGFQGPDGTSCCGDMDCVPATVFIRNQEAGDVEVDGEPMWVHPKKIFSVPPVVEVPEGFTGYFCKRNMAQPIEEGNVRCLFYRSGNY
jgi:hypothetical protein